MLRLEWPASPASELVSHYQVFQSIDGGGFSLIASPTVNHYEFTPVQGVAVWKVRAVNFVGISADSPTVDGPGVPSAPGQPTVTVVP